MTFLRRLLRKDINPEEYERVRCDLCRGTGLPIVNGRPTAGWLVPRHCGRCHGKGWLLVKKTEEVEG